MNGDQQQIHNVMEYDLRKQVTVEQQEMQSEQRIVVIQMNGDQQQIHNVKEYDIHKQVTVEQQEMQSEQRIVALQINETHVRLSQQQITVER